MERFFQYLPQIQDQGSLCDRGQVRVICICKLIDDTYETLLCLKMTFLAVIYSHCYPIFKRQHLRQFLFISVDVP